MAEEVIETRIARIWRDARGFVRIVILPDARLDLEDARALIDAEAQLAQGQRVASLADIREIKSVTREARLHFTGEEAEAVIKAQAVLVGSPLSVVIGNFYGLYGVPYPIRLFTVEERATDWLKQYIGG
jgi:hypothetical protein